jgi:transposase
MLLRTLMARLRDEPRVCSMVPIPDEADEEARRAHREREDLVRERRSILNKIDAILATLGVKGYRGLRSDRREQLALLRQPDCDPVPLAAWVRIERLLARLELILRQIKEGEAARDAVLKKPAPADEAERMIRSLVDMRASGPELTTLLVARLSHGRSPIVGRSDPMLDSSGRHFPAAEASANKARLTGEPPVSRIGVHARPDRSLTSMPQISR